MLGWICDKPGKLPIEHDYPYSHSIVAGGLLLTS